MRSLGGRGLPWRHGRALATSLGIHRRVGVVLHESVSGPMTYGTRRPTIVMPVDAVTWTDDELTRAIVHELEHIRRADWLTQCLARTLCAGYWFHPLVWIARRQLVLEAERASDDAVLRYADASAYADQLVDLAKRLSAGHQPLLAMATAAIWPRACMRSSTGPVLCRADERLRRRGAHRKRSGSGQLGPADTRLPRRRRSDRCRTTAHGEHHARDGRRDPGTSRSAQHHDWR